MKETNILIFGDSITYGAWDSIYGGWVNQLRLALEQRNNGFYQVYNLGIPDNTTEEVQQRFIAECDGRYVPGMNTVIIFAIGINDTQTINHNNRVCTASFEANMKQLITWAHQYTTKIIVMGLTMVDESKVCPLPWDPKRSYHNRSIIEYNTLVKMCAESQKGFYLELIDLLSYDDLSDGLHPNTEGHKKIFNQVIQTLEQYIK